MRTAGYLKQDLFILDCGFEENLLNLLCLDLLEEKGKTGKHKVMTDLMQRYPGWSTP